MKRILLVILSAFFTTAIINADDIKVSYVGNNNTMVKINVGSSRFLLMPVEEAAPDARVDVIEGGTVCNSFDVKLAQAKIDYYVPLELAPYSGKQLLLNIATNNNREGFKDPKSNVFLLKMQLSNTFDTNNTEYFRPAYHHTPLYGWMNDPNGMFYKDGVYHLYYQHNPYGSLWGNMTWGHSTSTDLIHWQHHPEAILPDAIGTVFSGSAVVDKEGTAGWGANAIVAMFTSAGRTQQQSIAYSTDGGTTFARYIDNPVIMNEQECRDEKVFWDEKHQQWGVVIVDALGKQVFFYASKDLKNWTRTGKFGQGYGSQKGIWECPDLMQLPVRGTKGEKKWVLINSTAPNPSGAPSMQYFVGEYDGNTFTCDDKPEKTKWVDFGFDNYALTSWSNSPSGRHTIMGWMASPQYAGSVPTKQYRSADTMPRDVELFRGDDGSLYLSAVPAKELSALRGEMTLKSSFSADNNEVTKTLTGSDDGLYEIDVTLKTNGKTPAVLTLLNDKGEEVVMTYNAAKCTFAFDRAKSGITNFSNDFPKTAVAPTPKGNTLSLRLFIDRSSIETFEGEGRFVMTNLVFPTKPYSKISFKNCKVKALNVYAIKI